MRTHRCHQIGWNGHEGMYEEVEKLDGHMESHSP